MPSSLGPAEILVILVVALIVLGPKKLPEAGRQVGRALAEVRRWSQSIQGEVRSVMSAVDAPGEEPDKPVTPGGPQPVEDSQTRSEPLEAGSDPDDERHPGD